MHLDELKHNAADFVRQMPKRSLSCLAVSPHVD